MLVEINLLPKKDRKSSGIIAVLAILLFVFLLAASFLYWKYHSTDKKINALNKEIALTQEIMAKEQKKGNGFESADSVKQLESSIEWAREYLIPAVPVMRHLTALLPDRGFIQSFAYSETGTLMLTVQFDTSREAAYFLARLTNSKWFEEASLTKLTVENENSNTGTGTASEEATGISKEAAYVPRYIGEFELTINRDTVKENSSEGKAAKPGEGVNES